MIHSPRSLLNSLFKGVEEPQNPQLTSDEHQSQASINFNLQLETALDNNEPLRLHKAFKSEGISMHTGTMLLHKRPYLNYQEIHLNSSQRMNEQEDILTLETASFKRKIRKPLKFENNWKNSQFQGRELQT
jgi:hypothetical protein